MLTNSSEFTTIFHPTVLALLAKRGITELYPPQWQALQKGLSGKNLIVSIPTASGKTLIAEILAFQRLNTSLEGDRGKILYLCPLKALAQEKYREFHDIWHQFGFQVGISTSDIDRTSNRIFKNDLIILTNEKADSILRLHPSLNQQISMVICDEIHLINDLSRGATLEFLLTRIRASKPEIQIVGLSATIQNAQDLAGWLKGELIKSTWRPVPLKEGYYLNGEIHFNDGTVRRVPLDPNLDEVGTLVIDLKKEGGQALIFANSRRSAMAGAESLAKNLASVASKEEKQLFAKVSSDYLDSCDDETKVSNRLSVTLSQGVAFHHAGLASDQLKFIVEKFSAHQITAIVCTPTLAAGVNTPARRVIIKTLYRFSDGRSQLIPILEYKQMAGRAGRPRYDPYGEVVILGSHPEKLIDDAMSRISGESELISSRLNDDAALQSHLLSLIVSKTAQTSKMIQKFLLLSFYYYMLVNYGPSTPDQQTPSRFQRNHEIQTILHEHRKRSSMHKQGGRGGDPLKFFDPPESLFTTASEILKHKQESEISHADNKNPQENEMEIIDLLDRRISQLLVGFKSHSIVESDQHPLSQTSLLIATKFGEIITQSYIPPQDAMALLDQLHLAHILHKNQRITLNSVSWLHILTQPQKARKFFLRKQDYPGAISFRDIHHDNFIMEHVWSPGDPKFEDFGKELKLTQILFDWINERHDRDIAELYNIGTGDLRRSIDNALWILRTLRQIARLDETFPWTESLKNLYYRLQHGILPNLIPLVQIRGIGRIRARKLYRAGFTSLSKLKSASVDDLALVPLIGDTLASQIKTFVHLSKAKRSIEGRKGGYSKEKFIQKKKKKKKMQGLDAFLKNNLRF